MTPVRDHVIGAAAGLGPAAVILGYYLVTRGPVQPGLLLFIVSPVVAGWLIGPRLDGTRRADAIGGFAYMIAAYLLHGAFGVVFRSLEGGPGLPGYLPALLEALGTGAVVTVIYLPFWAVVLLPLALVWVVTARILRAAIRAGLGGAGLHGANPGQPASRRTRSASLLWAPAAALVAYTMGFMVAAPSTCTATQTVSGDASVTNAATTVCSSLIGITYAGHGTFDPPREPAIVVGLVVATITFAVVLTALFVMRQAGRAGPNRSASP